MTQPLLTLYAVRSIDGKYFRSVGYGGGGKSWVDDLASAKTYARLGPARARVTWWARHHPKYGVPELVELRVTEIVAVDERARVQKRIKSLEEVEAERKRAAAKRELKHAEESLRKTERRIAELRSKQ